MGECPESCSLHARVRGHCSCSCVVQEGRVSCRRNPCSWDIAQKRTKPPARSGGGGQWLPEHARKLPLALLSCKAIGALPVEDTCSHSSRVGGKQCASA